MATNRGWPDLDLARLDKIPVLTVTLAAIASAGSATPHTTEMALHIDFPARVHDDDVQRWLHLGIEPGWTDTIDRLVRYLGETMNVLLTDSSD